MGKAGAAVAAANHRDFKDSVNFVHENLTALEDIVKQHVTGPHKATVLDIIAVLRYILEIILDLLPVIVPVIALASL